MAAKLIICIFAAVLLCGGCVSQRQAVVKICPGAESAEQLLSSLNLHSQRAVTFRANGRCLWKQSGAGKSNHKESFAVKLWVSPPGRLRFQGDIAFDPKGLVLCANEREYWLAIKPKEISGYWWGQWSQVHGGSDLKISPKILLEAFGIVDIDAKKNWYLSKEAGFDVLTEIDGDIELKKIYASGCTGLVEKIEYFDPKGQIIIVAETDRYREVIEDFFVPASIRIVSRIEGGVEDSFVITLTNIRPADFNVAQQDKLFSRPDIRGFEHIFENGIEKSVITD